MKTIFQIAVLIALLTACAGRGLVVDQDGTVYSGYFECLLYSDSRELSFDAVETLGNERLPKHYEFSEFDRKFLRMPDTIATVFEVYVRNHSGNPLHVESVVISAGNETTHYRPEVFDVAPGRFQKSDPVVSVTTIYRPREVPCKIEYVQNGKRFELTGVSKRLTMSELAR